METNDTQVNGENPSGNSSASNFRTRSKEAATQTKNWFNRNKTKIGMLVVGVIAGAAASRGYGAYQDRRQAM